eukprot:4734697-Amphidinium_carterae.1
MAGSALLASSPELRQEKAPHGRGFEDDSHTRAAIFPQNTSHNPKTISMQHPPSLRRKTYWLPTGTIRKEITACILDSGADSFHPPNRPQQLLIELADANHRLGRAALLTPQIGVVEKSTEVANRPRQLDM